MEVPIVMHTKLFEMVPWIMSYENIMLLHCFPQGFMINFATYTEVLDIVNVIVQGRSYLCQQNSHCLLLISRLILE